MIDRNSLEALRSAVRGKVIEPGDADYDESRKVYNGMIHKKPRVIVRCSDVADVIQCVYFGKKTGLPVAVRGGGHNAGGLGICDDGLVIDLAPIRYARVDPAARSVTVGGGCTWG
ncbi:MAG TPA: FAD-binding protein, partial [Chthoniobacterales bacterium]|nr:FAD-binding protein [Chthoniobacterales bacterium]